MSPFSTIVLLLLPLFYHSATTTHLVVNLLFTIFSLPVLGRVGYESSWLEFCVCCYTIVLPLLPCCNFFHCFFSPDARDSWTRKIEITILSQLFYNCATTAGLGDKLFSFSSCKGQLRFKDSNPQPYNCESFFYHCVTAAGIVLPLCYCHFFHYFFSATARDSWIRTLKIRLLSQWFYHYATPVRLFVKLFFSLLVLGAVKIQRIEPSTLELWVLCSTIVLPLLTLFQHCATATHLVVNLLSLFSLSQC